MSMRRALALVFLTLVLATGSVTMAVARHQMRAVGQLVLCTGYGIVMIGVDETGKPTGPILPCPDCTPALAALTEGAPPSARAPDSLIAHRFPRIGASLVRSAPPPHARARAPPVPA